MTKWGTTEFIDGGDLPIDNAIDKSFLALESEMNKEGWEDRNMLGIVSVSSVNGLGAVSMNFMDLSGYPGPHPYQALIQIAETSQEALRRQDPEFGLFDQLTESFTGWVYLLEGQESDSSRSVRSIVYFSMGTNLYWAGIRFQGEELQSKWGVPWSTGNDDGEDETGVYAALRKLTRLSHYEVTRRRYLVNNE